MTTANPEDTRRDLTWFGALRQSLDRPLTAYYLLLGASALLLTIGLIMVLSSSSVYSYKQTGDSYSVVKRQLVWVLIGLPCAWIASRLPQRAIRSLAWPALVGSMVLIAATQVPGLGVTRNNQTNWLGFGAVGPQPDRRRPDENVGGQLIA
ncbi:FtsW/RodA/SpoVE family cell cycle protein [Nocardia salmonicida]|uniref:FtsW/RodA/SpoVE family cell cycle protein n=1 Tax=Nocardia salmonicida TaxID=53431 RepID=UPI0033D4A936